MPTLIDTSGVYSLADRDDAAHDAVREYFAGADDTFVVPVIILPEVDYLVTSRLGIATEVATLRALSGERFRLEGLSGVDLRRALDLIEQYADSNIGLVDASIVAIAERLRITRILTLDQRHFRMFRPKHCAAFEIVP